MNHSINKKSLSIAFFYITLFLNRCGNFWTLILDSSSVSLLRWSSQATQQSSVRSFTTNSHSLVCRQLDIYLQPQRLRVKTGKVIYVLKLQSSEQAKQD